MEPSNTQQLNRVVSALPFGFAVAAETLINGHLEGEEFRRAVASAEQAVTSDLMAQLSQDAARICRNIVLVSKLCDTVKELLLLIVNAAAGDNQALVQWVIDEAKA